MIVGDDDQSIYAGVNCVENIIQRFLNDFPRRAASIRLEQKLPLDQQHP